MRISWDDFINTITRRYSGMRGDTFTQISAATTRIGTPRKQIEPTPRRATIKGTRNDAR